MEIPTGYLRVPLSELSKGMQSYLISLSRKKGEKFTYGIHANGKYIDCNIIYGEIHCMRLNSCQMVKSLKTKEEKHKPCKITESYTKTELLTVFGADNEKQDGITAVVSMPSFVNEFSFVDPVTTSDCRHSSSAITGVDDCEFTEGGWLESITDGDPDLEENIPGILGENKKSDLESPPRLLSLIPRLVMRILDKLMILRDLKPP